MEEVILLKRSPIQEYSSLIIGQLIINIENNDVAT